MTEGIVGLMRCSKRIYLDVCCLNRPFDDQAQERVRLEAEAIKSVLLRIGTGEWIGVGSDAIDFEIGRMPDPDRQLEIASITDGLLEHVMVEEPERQRGVELEKLGFAAADALHLACAERAKADVLLTTDDPLLKRASKHAKELAVRVANPFAWLEEVLRI
jgi:hypothetical protein